MLFDKSTMKLLLRRLVSSWLEKFHCDYKSFGVIEKLHFCDIISEITIFYKTGEHCGREERKGICER